MMVRVPPPVTGIICSPVRPRSSTVKNSRVESGDQVTEPTERSSESVRLIKRPVERSTSTRRQRSLS